MRSLVVALGVLAAITVAAGVAPAQDPKPAAAPAAGAPVTAPVSVCTNLAEPDCGTTAGCVWLPGYKVASGEEIKGYCRPAPKPINARRAPGIAPPAEQSK